MPQVQAFLTALGAVKNVTLIQSTKMGASKDGKIDGIYFRPVQ